MEVVMDPTIKKRLSNLEAELSAIKEIHTNQGISEELTLELQHIIEFEIVFLYLLLNE